MFLSYPAHNTHVLQTLDSGVINQFKVFRFLFYCLFKKKKKLDMQLILKSIVPSFKFRLIDI